MPSEPRWTRIFRRLKLTFRRANAERELTREINSHLCLLAEDFENRGMSPEEAKFAARRAFGGVEQTKELHRETRSFLWIIQAAQDLRYAVRGLRRSPVFAATALLVLTFGIAGGITVFALLQALVLRPYPYPESDRLVMLEFRADSHANEWGTTVPIHDYFSYAAQNTVFESIGTFARWSTNLNLTGQSLPGLAAAERITCGEASAGFLTVLGVQPALGRFFDAGEDHPGAAPVVVLSYATWQNRYGGRPDILGQTLDLSGKTYTIIGAMPANLRLPGVPSYQVWRPAAYNPSVGRGTFSDGHMIVARLKPGIPLRRADADLRLIAHRLSAAYPDPNVSLEVRVVPMSQGIAAQAGKLLWGPAGAVALVLLLTCANLAGLLLARGTARAREMAVRASLGAGRFRLIRQMLAESLLLSVPGGIIAMLAACWAIALLKTVFPPLWGLETALRIDAPVVFFACGVTLAVAFLSGLIPALRISRTDLSSALRGTSSGAAAPRHRLLSALVTSEVALALVLLSAGGVLLANLRQLLTTDLGIRTDHVLTFQIGLSGSQYEISERRSAFFHDLLARLRRLPGVRSAGAIDTLPMGGEFYGDGFTIDGRPAPQFWRDMSAQYCAATPGYFRAMGIPILLGREFAESDQPDHVVLINRRLARRFFGKENPLGQSVNQGRTIVGVVGDIRQGGPTVAGEPQIYSPLSGAGNWRADVALGTSGDPLQLARLVRAEVRALDPSVPLDKVKTMEQVAAGSVSEPRLVTALMSGFAIFALSLAAIGLYGVVAYSVTQRKQEIAIRRALGADYGTVVASILRRSALLSLGGAALGTPAALAGSHVLKSVLSNTDPAGAGILAAAAVLMLLVALAAGFLPAHRAARLDPLEALREG